MFKVIMWFLYSLFAFGIVMSIPDIPWYFSMLIGFFSGLAGFAIGDILDNWRN